MPSGGPFHGSHGTRFSPRAPGVSLRIINKAISDDDRKRREARRRIEELEERRRIEREREGNW